MTERTYITTGERIRNYLAIAFLFSLVLNAAGTLLYPDLQRYHDDTTIPTITIDRHARTSVRTPPPTPTPHPTATPPPQRQRVVQAKPFAPRVPRTRAITRSGPVARPFAAPTSGSPVGPPEASTGTAPACANPNQEASVTNVIPPEYPDSARDLGLGAVTVLVRVALDAQGRLVDATVAQSSNNLAIDQAALRSARQSSYAPRIVNCEPAAGEYIFRADFQP